MIEEKMGKELAVPWNTKLDNFDASAFKQILMELHESLDDNRGGMCSHVVEELTNCVVFGKLLT